MNFKLIMLSLLSLFMYSSVYSMDNQDKSKTSESLSSKHKTHLALLAGAATALVTYKFLPNTLFVKYAEAFVGGGSQDHCKAGFHFKLLSKTFYSKPIVPVNLVPRIHYFYVALKTLGSLYTGYRAYKLVKTQL